MTPLFFVFSTLAFADDRVTLPFTAPTEVRMFSDARILTGTGKVKGAACADAAAAAVVDLRADAAKKGYPDVLALFPAEDLKNWRIATEATCEIQGDPAAPKGSVVKIKGLATKPGQDPAYAKVTGPRAVEIVGSLIVPGSVIALQVDALRVDAHGTGLYYTVNGKSDVAYVAGVHKRNARIVETLRGVTLPALGAVAARVEGIPEITGVHFAARYTITEAGKEQTETVHLYVATQAAARFAAGQLTEQGLVDLATVTLVSGGAPVRVDVSFAAIDNAS